MPVYVNNTAENISWNGVIWGAGESKSVNFFVPDEFGLTKGSDLPKVAPQVLAAGVKNMAPNETIRIYIPACDAFIASLVCKSGRAVVLENYQNSTITIPIDAQNAYRAIQKRKDIESYWIINVETDANVTTSVAYNISKHS